MLIQEFKVKAKPSQPAAIHKAVRPVQFFASSLRSLRFSRLAFALIERRSRHNGEK